jgi:hypothetical protein
LAGVLRVGFAGFEVLIVVSKVNVCG